MASGQAEEQAGDQDRQPIGRGATSASGMARAALRPALRLYQRALPERTRLMVWAYRQSRARARQQRRFAADPARMAAARQALAETLAAHPEPSERKGVFIFAPSANWTTPLFQRPHQMALALAELGYLVLYCVHLDSTDDVDLCAEIHPNLVLCRVPPQVFHASQASHGIADDAALAETVAEALDEAVVVTYTHTAAWARQTGARRLIYELIDRFEIWPDAPWLMRAAHTQLLERASVVVGTATDLMAELTPRRPDALLCPNGVDYAHFAPAQTPIDDPEAPAAAPAAGADQLDDVPEDLRALVASGRPIIGYYGALAAWFDYALWAQVARALPEYHFVLIGPEYDLTLSQTAIAGAPNIHWLGPKPYAALPGYLRHFSVATIPFVVNATINAVSPIKLFEYMAGGKPIVTSDLVECRKYPVVLRATTPDVWVAQLREAVALGQDAEYRAALDETARANTWQARARLLTAALLIREPIERQQRRASSGHAPSGGAPSGGAPSGGAPSGPQDAPVTTSSSEERLRR